MNYYDKYLNNVARCPGNFTKDCNKCTDSVRIIETRSVVCNSAWENDVNVWHYRLDHISKVALHHLKLLNKNDKLDFCDICPLAKQQS